MLLVGMSISMMRNVVTALAESQFVVPRGSFMLLVAFVVAFGFVKGAMNFVAARMAEVMVDSVKQLVRRIDSSCSLLSQGHEPSGRMGRLSRQISFPAHQVSTDRQLAFITS
ncbi:hypothetical protein [Paraburkholderia sp. UYCP14C]|uniref:hypothetical protein n=1 Tax=Paraburkholderia sp. UYCP14C TaxID=2511130 RepID=UPI00200709F4|nr:hypothetical protein [Paraburkholderia sp. UYCP14C]